MSKGEQVATTAQGYKYVPVCSKHKSGNLAEFAERIDWMVQK